ncbi:MAG: ABC transporter ATP-binding protein [Actinobacteria bacterium]|jgi:ABC-2 type transport system ATP-binding protein|nr:ABC transporter ATP-binding protein [Actinomycetota bacterium]
MTDQPPPPPTPPERGAAVAVRGLSKRFGNVQAVDHFDLDVPHGSFFGLLGPNGAGKTTSLRMMTGLLRPDAGRVLLGGTDVWEEPEAVMARIGVLPEDLRLFDRLRGRELLTYTGLLRRMDEVEVGRRAGQLLALLDLEGAADEFVVDYSHGMRKKIALAAALLHAPDLLFLDEPFEAVDPVSGRAIRTVLQRFTARGGTVVISSHVMTLVEQLCDHVAIVNAGRVVAAGPRLELAPEGQLEDVFVRLVGGRDVEEEALGWLGSSSD